MHTYQATSLISPPDNRRIPAKAWLVFAMTFGLMLLDFIDRQIVASMFPFLKEQWQLSDKQLGALISVVSVTVALGTIPIAVLADRWGRARTIVAMALTWSGATLSCGLAPNYGVLLLARGAIGLGEAGYAPAGAAILSETFPKRMHGMILGAFQAAGAIGSILGVVLGGVLAARYGWQAAFGIVGVPGLVLALCYLWVRDPSRPQQTGAVLPVVSFWKAIGNGLALFKKPIVLWACAGGALQLFVVLSLYSWLPSYINRAYNVAPEKAGAQAAVVILLGALGAVFWGYAVDRLGRGENGRRLRIVAIGALLTGGFLTVGFGLLPAGQAQWICLMVGGFCASCAIGTVPAVVLESSDPLLRATSLALVVMVQNLFGQALGPFSTGVLSDALGLGHALAFSAGAAFLAAGAFFWAGVAQARGLKPG